MPRVTRSTLNGLVNDLRATHGENLASVVLYGSKIRGDSVEMGSNGNLLIALHHITPADLRNAVAPMREWERLGQHLPVYFTVAELHEAADVFPIEFHQMEQERTILYGEDVLASVEVSDANLRHQVEYELRSKLLQLRRRYIPASRSAELLADLMRESLASFASLFHAILLLHGEDAPQDVAGSTHAAVKRFHLDADTFEQILELDDERYESLTEEAGNELFAAYLAELEKVIDVVDRLDNKS